jgi:hypothetical protein
VLFVERHSRVRRVLNLPQMLRRCRSWVPAGGQYLSASCDTIEFRPGDFAEDIARLQAADVLVGLTDCP